MTAIISGVGGAVPSHTVYNSSFAELGLSDEWIVQRTGISTRYRLGTDELLADIASKAAQAALENAELSAKEIDFVAVATSTPDYVSPGLAPEVARQIGASRVGAVDLNGACTGFLYALDYGLSKVEYGSADKVLVIGADAMSRLTNPTDRHTAPLFGDGAGAVVVTNAQQECSSCDPYFSFGSSGEHASCLLVARDRPVVAMNGAEVYIHAVEEMSSELSAVLDCCSLKKSDVDLLVCHQANHRILNAVAHRLGWDEQTVASAVGKFGNTSSASIPLALAESVRHGDLNVGGRLAFTAFGAGFTWGAGVMVWKACPHMPALEASAPVVSEVMSQ